jgi:hypothetical protein
MLLISVKLFNFYLHKIYAVPSFHCCSRLATLPTCFYSSPFKLWSHLHAFVQLLASPAAWIAANTAAEDFSFAKRIAYAPARLHNSFAFISLRVADNSALLQHLFPRTGTPSTDCRPASLLHYSTAVCTLMWLCEHIGQSFTALSDEDRPKILFDLQCLLEDAACVFSQMPSTIRKGKACAKVDAKEKCTIRKSTTTTSTVYSAELCTFSDNSVRCMHLHAIGLHALLVTRLFFLGRGLLRRPDGSPLVSICTLQKAMGFSATPLGFCRTSSLVSMFPDAMRRQDNVLDFASPCLDDLLLHVAERYRCFTVLNIVHVPFTLLPAAYTFICFTHNSSLSNYLR